MASGCQTFNVVVFTATESHGMQLSVWQKDLAGPCHLDTVCNRVTVKASITR